MGATFEIGVENEAEVFISMTSREPITWTKMGRDGLVILC